MRSSSWKTGPKVPTLTARFRAWQSRWGVLRERCYSERIDMKGNRVEGG